MEDIKPKTFISYSWSSQGHRENIRVYAERLMSDGVDVILDQWDLREGQDKYSFMEKMIIDPKVTHVIIFCDKTYSKKADDRKAGVGAESQIISKEIYDKVGQKKFIPVVCEKDETGEPYLPVFLKSRIWIDFSSPELAMVNWEILIRALYNKPIHQKPELGHSPSYLVEDERRPSLPTIGKFEQLKIALLKGGPAVSRNREDFLDTAFSFVSAHRLMKDPDNLFEEVHSELRKLLPLRDQILEWISIEASLTSNEKLDEILINFLERFIALKFRPPEISSWSEEWYDANKIFIYELFLYINAILIKYDHPEIVHEILTSNYLLPEEERYRGKIFAGFEEFYTYSDVLERQNRKLSIRSISAIAHLIKERATLSNIPFNCVIQAELMITLMAILSENSEWYPHTLGLVRFGGAQFPFFIKASQHKHFKHLQKLTGIASADELRKKFLEGCQKHRVGEWHSIVHDPVHSLFNYLNMDGLDKIK